MAYQGLLLSDRRRLRTESIEEHATPNSSPAQWPGENSSAVLIFVYIFYLEIPFYKPTDWFPDCCCLWIWWITFYLFVFDDIFCHGLGILKYCNVVWRFRKLRLQKPAVLTSIKKQGLTSFPRVSTIVFLILRHPELES